MSVKHSIGVIAAGLVALGAVWTASLLFSPEAHDTGGSDSGEIAGDSEESTSEHGGETGTDTDETSADTASAIVGRWQAPEPANQDAFVEFTEDGLWFASDGCNSTEGAWKELADGSIDVTSGGAMTQVGCDNVPIPEWIWGAEDISVLDDTLELTDAEDVSSTLLRTGESSTTLVGAWIAPGDQTRFTTVLFNEDGTWSGETGCQVIYGTWELQVPEDPDTEMFVGPPARLVIGPEPDDAETSPCEIPGETSLTLPIDFDTRYYISMREHSASIRDVDAPIETQFVLLHRVR